MLKRRETEGNPSLEALLKLLPALAMSYPNLTSLVNQLSGQPQDSKASLQEAVPKITQTLAQMDQEKREELVRELLRFFPELEKVLKQSGARS